MTLREHERHGWERQSTAHIRNVAYLTTHWLMKCPCGWYGWAPREGYER
jgi:hypothetical protein